MEMPLLRDCRSSGNGSEPSTTLFLILSIAYTERILSSFLVREVTDVSERGEEPIELDI